MVLELPLGGCAVALELSHAPLLASLRFRVVRNCLLVGLASSSALKRNKHAGMGGGTGSETSRVLNPLYTQVHPTNVRGVRKIPYGGVRGDKKIRLWGCAVQK